MRSTLPVMERPEAVLTGDPLVAPLGLDAPSREERLGSSLTPGEEAELGSRLRMLRLAFWGIALLLGAFDACWRPFAMAPMGSWPDGVAYIDIAAAYARGDWAHALNAYWSPLYSWLLAPAIRILHPSALTEFPVVHLVNLVIYVAALGCFDYLWRGWMEDHQARSADAGPSGWIPLPSWALLAVGYSLFIWASIRLIGVQMMTPDLLTAGLFYLAAGVTLRLRCGESRPGRAVLASPFMLGTVLGLGFLAKAVMLPLALVFLLAAFLPVRNLRRAAPGLLRAGLAFLIVTTPFIAALSHKEGRLTLGDTGRFNYAWYVNNVPQLNWQGDPPGYGHPIHPTRLICAIPPVYAFPTPASLMPGETDPIWTDPSRWNQGLRPRFNARQQAGALVVNLKKYGRKLLWVEQSGLVVGTFLLLLATTRAAKRRWPAHVRGDLLLLGLAPIVLYALVVVDSRYVSAPVVLFWLALFPAVRLPRTPKNHAMLVAAALAMLLTLGLGLARMGIRDLVRRDMGRDDWETAAGLHALGIREGDPVGCIGLPWEIGWARLARVSIVAQAPLDNPAHYWNVSPSARATALRAFAKAGARAVVAERPPSAASLGWHRLGATNRYVYLLRPPTYNSTARAGTTLSHSLSP